MDRSLSGSHRSGSGVLDASYSFGNLDLRTRFLAGLGFSSRARLRLAGAVASVGGKGGTLASSRASMSTSAMRRATGVRLSVSEAMDLGGEVRAWEAT